jgi:hypothetical protein
MLTSLIRVTDHVDFLVRLAAEEFDQSVLVGTESLSMIHIRKGDDISRHVHVTQFNKKIIDATLFRD